MPSPRLDLLGDSVQQDLPARVEGLVLKEDQASVSLALSAEGSRFLGLFQLRSPSPQSQPGPCPDTQEDAQAGVGGIFTSALEGKGKNNGGPMIGKRVLLCLQ